MCDVARTSPGTAEPGEWGTRRSARSIPRVIYLSCSTYGQYGPCGFTPAGTSCPGRQQRLKLTGYPDTEILQTADYLATSSPETSGLWPFSWPSFSATNRKGPVYRPGPVRSLIRLLSNFTAFKLTGTEVGDGQHRSHHGSGLHLQDRGWKFIAVPAPPASSLRLLRAWERRPVKNNVYTDPSKD